MHPIFHELIAIDRMATAREDAAQFRLARAANSSRHTWRLALADRALRIARRLDRDGAVVPAPQVC